MLQTIPHDKFKEIARKVASQESARHFNYAGPPVVATFEATDPTIIYCSGFKAKKIYIRETRRKHFGAPNMSQNI